jgi:hypothetical protein
MAKSYGLILSECLLHDDQADCTALASIAERFGVSAINQFAWNIRDLLPDLTTEEIVKLVKLFTRLEVCISDFCGGSTSQVHVLLHALSKRDRRLAEELRIWAFHTTKNPYVPFGTRGAMRGVARSVAEYYRLTHERREQVAEAERLRSERAKRRKEARAIAHAARTEAHKVATSGRDALVESLARIDPARRLETIARDREHPPYYYPEVFAEVDRTVLDALEPGFLVTLAERLSRAPRGKWRNLRRMIVSHGI